MAWNTPEDWSYKEAPGSSKMNEQVRDNLTYLKASLPAGVMLDYAGASAPEQWLLCNGAAVSRTTYAALFAAIGTTYGAGDSSSTFNVPDSRGRATIGAGQGTSLTNRTLGATVGTETHTLTSDEMPSHTHTTNASRFWGTRRSEGSSADASYNDESVGQAAATINSTGGGASHNNMQPSLVVTKIIKY